MSFAISISGRLGENVAALDSQLMTGACVAIIISSLGFGGQMYCPIVSAIMFGLTSRTTTPLAARINTCYPQDRCDWAITLLLTSNSCDAGLAFWRVYGYMCSVSVTIRPMLCNISTRARAVCSSPWTAIRLFLHSSKFLICDEFWEHFVVHRFPAGASTSRYWSRMEEGARNERAQKDCYSEQGYAGECKCIHTNLSPRSWSVHSLPSQSQQSQFGSRSISASAQGCSSMITSSFLLQLVSWYRPPFCITRSI